jgi:flagellar motor switch protein FliG
MRIMAGNKALTAKRKASAVIVALGADNASRIYKYLREEEIEKLR